MADVRIYPNRLAASRAMAQLIAQIADSTIALRDRFTLVLSGGNTPREAYKMLGDEFGREIEWSQTHVFWGDERCVPFEHPDNNAKMARETLLNYVPISIDHMHRVQSFHDPETAAALYQMELQHFFMGRGGVPRFDLILLGIGGDGHTASLFPDTPALDETERWFVPNYIPKLDATRMTMTFPVLNAAANIVFLVLGEDKADALAHILANQDDPPLPAARIAPPHGKVMWIVDDAAASKLDNPYKHS